MGLASCIRTKCEGCEKLFRLRSSPYFELTKGQKHFEVNVRAVWGEAVSGGGAFKMNEQLGTMHYGHPRYLWKNLHQDSHICEWWERLIHTKMLQASTEERRLAIERGDFHEGVPAITVGGGVVAGRSTPTSTPTMQQEEWLS